MNKNLCIILNILAGNIILFLILRPVFPPMQTGMLVHSAFSVFLLLVVSRLIPIIEQRINTIQKLIVSTLSLYGAVQIAGWIIIFSLARTDDVHMAWENLKGGLAISTTLGALYWLPFGILNVFAVKPSNKAL